jgi:hypothetical protein
MATNLPMVKPLLGTAVGLQSLALVGVAAQTVPKGAFDFTPKKRMKKINHKKQTGKMIKGFTGLMVGIPLVGATAGMVNQL